MAIAGLTDRSQQFEMVFERPPRSLREINLFSPSVRGRAAEGGRGALTRHL